MVVCGVWCVCGEGGREESGRERGVWGRGGVGGGRRERGERGGGGGGGGSEPCLKLL